MSKRSKTISISELAPSLGAKLAGYLAAASAFGVNMMQEAQAVVVSNTTIQPFGINGTVDIDFNNDSQIDFQIDHDRVNLNGTDLDYLQIDKNDVNGEANPLDVDSFEEFLPVVWNQAFPVNSSPNRNNDNAVLSFTNDFGDQGGYPVALKEGDVIGPAASTTAGSVPGTVWDWQEGGDGFGSGGYIRANRLIDEDRGKIDKSAGRTVVYDNPSFSDVPFGPQPEFPDLDDFVGLAPTDVRYLGVRVDLNDAGYSGNEISTINAAGSVDNPLNYWYGWIGIRITNEADATGEVVGYAYETQKGMQILAGDVGTPTGLPGDYNGNNTVDAADYTIWRDRLGQSFTLANEDPDAATPGLVDEDDFTFWKSQFGMSLGSGAGAGSVVVPEPGSIATAAIGGALVLGGWILRKWFCRNRQS